MDFVQLQSSQKHSTQYEKANPRISICKLTVDSPQLQKYLSSRTRSSITDSQLIRAAVLVGLTAEEGDSHFLLTRRTHSVESHKGQVSFPGGVIENSESAIDASIRESYEETHLKRESITILGMLDDLKTPTGYVISPVVAVINYDYPLKPNQEEVARIFTAPVSLFLDEKNVRTETRWLSGENRTVYLYDYDGETIWGVTALIIRMFVDVLNKL